jgi:hypothetical protein
MSSAVNDHVAVDVGASSFAFRASQLLERLLLDGGIELARRSGASIVTEEHVESCLDDALFDRFLKRVRESPDGGSAAERGVRDGQSGKAA